MNPKFKHISAQCVLKKHKGSVFLVHRARLVFQVMPPQYLEQNDESSSGSVPRTPINHGPDLSTSSTLKGASVQFDFLLFLPV